MLNNKKVAVVLPAFNSAKTLERTFNEIPHDIVDEIILGDNLSTDDTVAVAKRLGIKHILQHEYNSGYGGNQKRCYTKALSLNADIIIMLHPDYQYTPKLLLAMVSVIAYEVYPVMFASRILGRSASRGGMPLYKLFSNRVLTYIENFVMGEKLSEYHTGYRAYTADVLRSINFMANSDDFIFDNEIIAQLFMKKILIGEITCPTKYFPEASSIRFLPSIRYGLGVLRVTFTYRLAKWKLLKSKLF